MSCEQISLSVVRCDAMSAAVKGDRSLTSWLDMILLRLDSVDSIYPPQFWLLGLPTKFL